MRNLRNHLVTLAREAVDIDKEPQLVTMAKYGLYISTTLAAMAVLAILYKHAGESGPFPYLSLAGFAAALLVGILTGNRFDRLGCYTSAAYAPTAIITFTTAWYSSMISEMGMVASAMFCIHIVLCIVVDLEDSRDPA